jgi:3-oxoadipate enol-lactonase
MSHELSAGLPDARLVILDGCAHVPQLQSPGAFLDSVRDFLRPISASASAGTGS